MPNEVENKVVQVVKVRRAPGRFTWPQEKITCPTGFKHETLLGKSRTSRAAEYPEDLCLEYAKLIIRGFRTVLNLEWWRNQEKVTKQALTEAQRKWVENKEKKAVPRALDNDAMRSWRCMERSLDTDIPMKDELPEQVQPSKKQKREQENDFFLGGMRNPQKAVSRLSVLAEAGQDMTRLWKTFARQRPEVFEAARLYGSDRCVLDEVMVREWDAQVRKLLKADLIVVLKEKPGPYTFVARAMAVLKGPGYRHCGRAAKGVPLGMAAEIPMSKSIFPPVEEADKQPQEAPDLELQTGAKNYTSMVENEEAAKGEIQRLEEKGFVGVISKETLLQSFDRGTVSKLALISKQKESGQWKHRVITDLLRSGGNGRAVVPERIVLPRICDFVRGVQKMWAKRLPEEIKLPGWGMELIGCDLADAYCHFAVAPAELSNCISPGVGPDDYLIFKAVMFGYKGAPLIMGRLSSMMARQWQSFFKPHQGVLQCYMDDPLMCIAGTSEDRDTMLSMLLRTAKIFGINLSYGKGERGQRLTWIGVTIELDVPQQEMVLTVPQKLVDETRQKLEQWSGMVPLRELRAITGKLSWLAGILTKARWAVSIMYAVVADVEKDLKEHKEEDRASKRQDSREKPHLVPVKRLALPRAWFIRLLGCDAQWRTRRVP